jgi:putative methyltransferase (TIGR04325 family)
MPQSLSRQLVRLAKTVAAFYWQWRPQRLRFRGAYVSRSQALAAIPSHVLAGYDSEEVVPICYAHMCEMSLWDYPVVSWLQRVLPSVGQVLDAGGHMGTKYRAFGRYIDLASTHVEWTIYDVPAIVRAGRAQAVADGLARLRFTDDLGEAPSADLLLASGLLQYLDVPFPEFLRALPVLPRHLLLNKVAMWSNPSTFTLENFGVALVPYQIRNRDEFLESIRSLGYTVVDEWHIEPLSHVIRTHPHLGRSTSVGFYMTRASED